MTHDLNAQLASDARFAREFAGLAGWRRLRGEWEGLLEQVLGRRHTLNQEDLPAVRSEAAVLRLLIGLPEAMAARLPDAVPPQHLPDAVPIPRKRVVDVGFLMSQIGPRQRSRWTEESALAAVRAAEEVAEAVAHPAWLRLMAILAALHWLCDEALKLGGLMDDAASLAALKALDAPAAQAAKVLRAGVDARTFLDSLVKLDKETTNA